MSESTQPLRWGILAIGSIARKFTGALQGAPSGTLEAVASREIDKALEFKKKFPCPKAYGSYGELLADPEVDAVYIATPHPLHAKWCIRAAEAGKDILCEKPLTLNAPDAMMVIDAADQNKVFLMEAFMYRCHPQTARILEIIRSGRLGEIRRIEADFSFSSGDKPESRLESNRLGGGGILDVGCYPVSFARLVAGAARGLPFAEPLSVKGTGQVDPKSGVDHWAAGVLKFEDGLTAVIQTGIKLAGRNQAVITGTKGRLTIPGPWFCSGTLELETFGPEGTRETIAVDAPLSLYAYEIEAFAKARANKGSPWPGVGAEDALGNMWVLDDWRREVGVVYEEEKPGGQSGTLRGGRLRARGQLPRLPVPGLGKEASRMVIGTMLPDSLPLYRALMDTFFESGGNAVDTAFIYGGGTSEARLGEWMEERGVRDEMVLMVKGAHTPHCDPKNFHAQLAISLERLHTDHADLYLFHRDNPEIPVGELVDAVDAEIQAGRVGAWGGSNWTPERIDAAIAHAAENGRHPPVCVSINHSLARMVNPVWKNSLSVSDPTIAQWHRERRLVNFAWSAQARGFFTDQSAPDKTSNPSLVRSWYAEDNFERKRRATELARQRGCSPTQIAAAYVLHRDPACFALMGPWTVRELRENLASLDLVLTEAECAWLNLETDTPGGS